MADNSEGWPANAAGQDDDIVMVDAADTPHSNLYDNGNPSDEEGFHHENHGDHGDHGGNELGDSTNQNPERDTLGEQNVNTQSPTMSRQFPIEVLLRPPPNRKAYEAIHSSRNVWRVLDEYDDGGGGVMCIVEFVDGHIEDVAYDDMVQCVGGQRAAQQFQDRRLSTSQVVMSRQPSKRANSEDDYYESCSQGSKRAPLRKRPKIAARATRRSTRQASTQASRPGSVQPSEDSDQESNGSHGESDEDMDEVVSHRPTHRNPSLPGPSTRRVTRSKGVAQRNQHASDGSEDELAQDRHSDQDDNDDDDVIPIIRSDIGGPRRKSTRKKKRPQARRNLITYIEDDSEIEFEPSRRSKRSTKVSKSMRDPELDDEYEAVDDKATSAPKAAAIKEIFEAHTERSSFKSAHYEVCDTCGSEANHGKGPLILCQGCSYSYHQACIGIRSLRDHRVTKVGPNAFVLQCKFCIGVQSKKDLRAPNYAMCQTCKQLGPSCAEFSPKRTTKQEEKARLENDGVDPITDVDPELVNNADHVLFRCSTCRRAYHFEHLPPLVVNPSSTQSIREERLDEYSLAEWQCKDCLDARHKIHALVAWRPVNQAAYIEGQQSHQFLEDDVEYLVKWQGRSHLHDTWMPGAWVYGVSAATMRIAFHKKEETILPKMTTESAVDEGWLLADVILMVRYRQGSIASSKTEDLERISDIDSVFVKFQGLSYEEAVWDEPPPRDSEHLWVAFTTAYEEYLNGKYFSSVKVQKMRDQVRHYRSLDFQTHCELKDQPAGLREGRTLMKYQMEGVNWLLYNFHQQQNVILADEMGLGKTIQIVSFITSLVQDQPNCWPFIIVVPNATCPNWRREIKDWAPDLRVVAYHGGRVAQDLAYKYELFPNGAKDGMKAHVVIMSYESASTAGATFQGVKWAGLIVDEGQRLKNEETLLYKALMDLKIPCRILLTGTPLQNNKKELFTLLQFIDTQHNAEELDAQYSELTKHNVPELHALIRPYFLRRTKAQVLRFLPPMAQVIVPVTMTVLQEKLSKSIMSRNPELIKAIITRGKMKAGDRKGLTNIMSDLRQCLCHPFCFSNKVEDRTVSEEQMQRNLIEASPKLMLLNIMLPKLKESGHRVLIFSQFLGCLDILEDFLAILGLKYGRIDGRIDGPKKQRQIDEFNAPDSPLFAMLLSTRAGGVGINLATADTVIIFDPDWNPHQDLQAISRAHRIGQKEKVLCFQLITKETVEENILQKGKKKLALDHALIESLDADNDTTGDVEEILKRGAEALFSDKDKVKITYDSAAVDRLLDRSWIVNTTDDDHPGDTQFSFARVWAKDSGTLTDNPGALDGEESSPADVSVWERILKLREEEHERERAAKKEVLGRGARRRSTRGVDYSNSRRPEPDSGGSDVDGNEDELYIDNGADDDEDEIYEEDAERQMPGRSKGQKAATLSATPPISIPSTLPSAAPPIPPPTQPDSLPAALLASLLATEPTQPRTGARSRPTKAERIQAMAAERNQAMTSQYTQGTSAALSQAMEAKARQILEEENSRAHQLVTRTSKPIIKYRPSVHQAQVAASTPVGQPPPQTRAPPPQSIPPGHSTPSLATNPNLVVSIARREQLSLPVAHPSFTNARHPVPPPNVLRSTPIATPPLPREQPNGSSKGLPILPTGSGGMCLVCKAKHPPNKSCVNLNSEISLRIALDSLRARGDAPNVRACKDILARQLRQLVGR